MRFLFFVVMLIPFVGCTHFMIITSTDELYSTKTSVVNKKVAYVMTNADRQIEIITALYNGSTVRYFPYRDLEKNIRDVLKSVYEEVYVFSSSNDKTSLEKCKPSFIFTPEITTHSTWPPKKFTIEAVFNVTDIDGNLITRPRAVGNGTAESSEFTLDYGLAGKRAASNLFRNLQQEIKSNPKLN